MRATKRRRPLPRDLCKVLEVSTRQNIVELVSYVGSPEHKDAPNKLIDNPGQIRPRSDATI